MRKESDADNQHTQSAEWQDYKEHNISQCGGRNDHAHENEK
jgi:hypothetical protein